VRLRYRLARYGAGRMIRYQDAADPDRLAIAIAEELSAQTRFHPVETDGAILL